MVLRDKKCSTSYIQRRLSVGYNKAASLVERMEKDGIVGPANHAGKREILIYSADRGSYDLVEQGLYGRLSGIVLRPAGPMGDGPRPVPSAAVRPSLLLSRLDALRPKPVRRRPIRSLE